MLCMITAKQWTSLTRLYFDVPETGIETSITAAPTLGNQWCGKGWAVAGGGGGIDREAGTEAKGIGTQSSRLQVRNEWKPLTRKPVSCSACHTQCWHVSAAWHSKVSGSRQQKQIRKLSSWIPSIRSTKNCCLGI